MTHRFAKTNTDAFKQTVADWDKTTRQKAADPDDRAALFKRAVAYLEKEPPAVSGQHGHDRAFHVACVLVCRFGLTEAEAFAAIVGWNMRCEPPWEEKDLRRKLREAAKQPITLDLAGGPPTNGANGHTVNGAPIRPPSKPRQPEPWEPPIPLSELPAAEPFPVDVLPASLQQFVREMAWATESPPDFAGTLLLAFAGGAIGNSRWLRVTRTHVEPPCVFAYIVGRPSSGKSPAFRQLKAPFVAADRQYRLDHRRELDAWENRPPESKEPRPVLRRCLTDNATVESILKILSDTPRGVLLARGELSGLIGGFNQYKEGGRGNDRETFLQFWDCESIIVDRKSNPDGYPLIAERPFVGVVGTIQPKVVDKLRRQDGTALDDGFLERFLCSYPDPLPAAPYTRRDVSAESQAAWNDAVRWLLSLDMISDGEEGRRPRFFGLSAAGMAAWVEFTRRHAEEINDPAFPEHLEAAWGKLRGYCLRFALILHLLDSAVDGLDESEVDEVATERAARLVAYFKAHVRRVGTVLDLDPRVAQARKVLSWLKAWGKPTVSRRDLWRGLRRSFNRPEELHPPLQLLHHSHYIRPVGEPAQGNDSRRGQPTDVYEINPTINPLVTGDMGDMGDRDRGDAWEGG